MMGFVTEAELELELERVWVGGVGVCKSACGMGFWWIRRSREGGVVGCGKQGWGK